MNDMQDRPTAKGELEHARQRTVTEFGRMASQFDSKYETMAENYFSSAFAYGRKKLDDLLFEMLEDLPKGSEILDIGCGTGEQVNSCRKLGFNVTGIEPSSEMREIAQRRNPGIPISDGTILKLPFEDNTFDVVLAIEVLRYFRRTDIQQAYCEMVRVLKPHGKMFFTMVNRFALDGFYAYSKLRQLYSHFIRHSDALFNEFVTPRSVRHDLSNLNISEIEIYGRLFAPLRIIYKISESLAEQVARFLESFDNEMARKSWMAPFSGHLVIIATCAETNN